MGTETRRQRSDGQPAATEGGVALFEESAIPVLRVWDGILAVPLVGVIDSKRASALIARTLQQITEERAKVVIIDVTGIPVIDTEVANHLLQMTQAARLLGAGTFLVGITPDVAQTLVHLGVDLSHMRTAATLRDGLRSAFDGMGLEVVARKAAAPRPEPNGDGARG